MSDVRKLATLLDDPEVRDLVRGLAGNRPDRLRAIVLELAETLPDLVDALSPGGRVIEVELLTRELAEATTEDDLEAGVFGE